MTHFALTPLLDRESPVFAASSGTVSTLAAK
jgi:hypothetical protein